MKLREYVLEKLMVDVDPGYVSKPTDKQLSFIEVGIDVGATGKPIRVKGKFISDKPYKADRLYEESDMSSFDFDLVDFTPNDSPSHGSKTTRDLQTALEIKQDLSNGITNPTLADLFTINKEAASTKYNFLIPSHSKYNASNPLISGVVSLAIEVEDTDDNAPDISEISYQGFTCDTLNTGAPVGAFKGALENVTL